MDIQCYLGRAISTAAGLVLSGKPRQKSRAFPEPLESRTLLTTDLTLYAGAGGGNFTIRLWDQTTVQVFQNVPETAAPTASVPVNQLGTVTLNCGNPGDTLAIDFAGGNPLPNGLNFNTVGSNANQAPDALTFIGLPNANVSIDASPGGTQITIAGTDVNNDSFVDNISTGTPQIYNLFTGGNSTLTLSGVLPQVFNQDLGAAADSAVSVFVDFGTSVSFGSTQHLAALNIASGGSVQMNDSVGSVSANASGGRVLALVFGPLV